MEELTKFQITSRSLVQHNNNKCSIHILGTGICLFIGGILFGAEKMAVKSMDIRSGGKLGTTEFFFCLDISPIYTMYSKGFFFEAGLCRRRGEALFLHHRAASI